jgi:phosphate transport system substrate-binding protein
VFKKTMIAVGVTAMTFAGAVQAQSARDYISIAGSSTVFPFSSAVAEQFGRGSKFKTPKVESVGTGGGLKLFCQGVGPQYTDISNASRRIKESEVANCEKNGVKDIVEVKIGFDGIVLANSKAAPTYELSRKDLYMALAKQVPDPANPTKLVDNPYKTWNQIDKKLPNVKIEVLGPPPTSGTRDAFAELVLEKGCESFPSLEDLQENMNKLHGSIVEGKAPTFENVADGSYPVARSLYVYVKKAHVGVIPGIQEFIAEFTSEKAMGDEGYLADKGLIPLPKAEREKVRKDAAALTSMKL